MIKIQDTYSFEILCEDVRIMPVEMDWISVEVFGVRKMTAQIISMALI